VAELAGRCVHAALFQSLRELRIPVPFVADLAITSTERALETLSTSEQTALLQLVIKTIRALQIAGAISPQRMCVTCRHFRPYVHDDARTPHHCAYVDAAFGAEALRLDCGEHDALTAIDGEIVWKEYAREDILSGNQMRDSTG
jgi:hypothetical protein